MMPVAHNKNQKNNMAELSLEGRRGVRMLPHAILFSFFIFLAASCTPKGDFGYDKPSIITDKFLPAMRTFVGEYHNKEPVTKFPLTQDEALLRTYRARIGRDMMFPTVESHYTFAVSSMGFVKEPLPHSGEEFRTRKNVIKPVVDISSEARRSPFALKEEIAEDESIIHRMTLVGKRVLQSDELRRNRLRSLKFATKSDRDNVAVRAYENRRWIAYIHHVAKLRIKRYYRAIDELSLSHPQYNLQPSRQALKVLRAELTLSKSQISQRSIRLRKRTMPVTLLGARSL